MKLYQCLGWDSLCAKVLHDTATLGVEGLHEGKRVAGTKGMRGRLL